MDDDHRIVSLTGKRNPASDVEDSKPRSREVKRPLQAEIDDLLHDDPSSPVTPPSTEWLPAPEPSGLRAPPPNHRHGVACPQCNEWTWRYSELCVHCGFNLFEYEKQRSLIKARRQQAAQRARVLRWMLGLIIAGVTLLGLHLWLGAWTEGWLLLAALACFYCAGVLYKALPETE